MRVHQLQAHLVCSWCWCERFLVGRQLVHFKEAQVPFLLWLLLSFIHNYGLVFSLIIHVFSYDTRLKLLFLNGGLPLIDLCTFHRVLLLIAVP
jgi:hypothetical protein